jgi:hypothetical protein
MSRWKASKYNGGIMDKGPNPNEKLVKVFDCEQESEALVVRGLLESNGIDCFMTAVDTDQELFPVGGVIIQVREDQEDEARRLIEESRGGAESNLPADAPEALSEEPPQK